MAFRGGAFAPGVPVQAVCVRYPHKHFDLSWTSEIDMPFHCWRMLSQLVAHMEVEWLPVHYPSKAEQADPLLFAKNVRASMAKCLNVPVTEHSYDDTYFGMHLLRSQGRCLCLIPSSYAVWRRSMHTAPTC